MSVSAGSDGDAGTTSAISAALDFAAGTVAGVASLLTGHPFDTVKVRLQTQASTSVTTTPRRVNPSAPPPPKYYRNAVHAFVRVTKEEGVAGLYKGVTSPMLGVALMNASVFTSYKYTMNALLSRDGQGGGPDPEPTLLQITAAGSASGVFTSLITTPIDRLKILQQSLPPGPSPSASPSETTATLPRTRALVPPIPYTTGSTTTLARPPPPQRPSSRPPSLATLLRTLSLRSLYRGWSATLLRDVGYGPYFLVYEYVVRGGNFGLASLLLPSSSSSTLSSPSPSRAGRPRADLKDEIDAELWGLAPSSSSLSGMDDAEAAASQGGASTARILMAGGLAGIVGWGCTFPIDVIKTKMQSVPPVPLVAPSTSTPASTFSSPSSLSRLHPSSAGSAAAEAWSVQPAHRYATIPSTIAATLQESGWRGFVAGLGPTLLRSIPVNMVTFAVFELVVSTFR
ncbi:hypothetical protein JCM3774_005305 [Rhodotorula dairenensis]